MPVTKLENIWKSEDHCKVALQDCM